MSDATKAALELALAAHIADEEENPQIVTGYILAAAITSFNDAEANRHEYWFDCPDNQPAHTTRGLSSLLDEWACAPFSYQEGDE